MSEAGKMSPPLSAAEIARLPYRPCVGLVVMNGAGAVFAGQRIDNPGDAWQAPQGGADEGETPREAALRELGEETGIAPGSVEIIAETDRWIPYDLPADLVPKLWGGRFRGQEQKWFLLRFTGRDEEIVIDGSNGHEPEFSRWRWMAPEDLIERIVPFKRATYDEVLGEFAGQMGRKV